MNHNNLVNADSMHFALCSGVSCFGTHLAHNFLNNRCSGTILHNKEREICGKWPDMTDDEFRQLRSFSNLSIFTYVTAHSPTLLSLLLRHRLFTYFTWRSALVTKFSQNIVADTDKNKALIDWHKCSFHSFLLSSPTLLKSLPVSWKRFDQVAVSSYSS